MASPQLSKASKNTYLLCPVDETLWDLKFVISTAFELNRTQNVPSGWVTDSFQQDISALGFAQLKFLIDAKHPPKGRMLGIRGFDATELFAPHLVIFPNGDEAADFLSPDKSNDKPAGNASRSERLINGFVRNQTLVAQVKKAAKGRCDRCGHRGFKTATGERYLEVHHKVWLSEGGKDEAENLVALCAVCHAKEHFGCKRAYR